MHCGLQCIVIITKRSAPQRSELGCLLQFSHLCIHLHPHLCPAFCDKYGNSVWGKEKEIENKDMRREGWLRPDAALRQGLIVRGKFQEPRGAAGPGWVRGAFWRRESLASLRGGQKRTGGDGHSQQQVACPEPGVRACAEQCREEPGQSCPMAFEWVPTDTSPVQRAKGNTVNPSGK